MDTSVGILQVDRYVRRARANDSDDGYDEVDRSRQGDRHAITDSNSSIDQDSGKALRTNSHLFIGETSIATRHRDCIRMPGCDGPEEVRQRLRDNRRRRHPSRQFFAFRNTENIDVTQHD